MARPQPFYLPSSVPGACSSAVRTGVVQRPKDKLLTMDPKEITYEMVQKKLQEIAMARGKTTRIDRQEQVSRPCSHGLQARSFGVHARHECLRSWKEPAGGKPTVPCPRRLRC